MNKIAFLAIALVFLIGDSVADNPKPTAAYESKPAAKVPRDQPDFLIDPWRDKVKPGEVFKVRIWQDLPYKIQPEPRRMTSRIEEETGDRMLEIMAGEESITIIIEYEVIHPTAKELKAAPAFGDSMEAWVKWNLDHAEDEHYHDSRTVLVEGDGPGPPGPEPTPEPDEDLSEKVKAWLSTVESPRKKQEQQSLAKLYQQLASRAAAGGITEDGLFEEMTAGHLELGPNARRWFSFFKSFGEAVNSASGLKDKGKVFKSVGEALESLNG